MTTGPRVLLTTSGTAGDVLPFLTLAERLRDRGARPRLLLNPFDVPRAERRGLEAIPVGDEAIDVDALIRERPELMGPMGGPITLKELYAPSCGILVEAARAALADGADAVCCHPMGQGLAWAAAEAGVPVSVAHLSPSTLFDTKDLGHLPIPMRWGAGLGLPLFLWMLDGWLKPYCEAAGVAWRRGIFKETATQSALTLALWSPLLEGDAAPPDPIRCGFPPPPDGLLPPAVDAFLDAGLPPIALALGTSAVHVAGALPAAAIAAARAAGRRVIAVGLPPQDPPADDVLYTPAAPYGSLFARCVAVIHHGGIGTSAAAVWAGAPALVIPFAHDQPDNAARLVRLGVAETAGRGAGAKALEAALSRLLAEASRERAQEIAQAVRGQGDGADAAAAALLAWIAGS